jgi:hypothetical protein
VCLEIAHNADDLEPGPGLNISRGPGFAHEPKATTERGTVAEEVLREDVIDDDRGAAGARVARDEVARRG